MVYPQENSFLSNRVELVWADSPDDEHKYTCTCKFPTWYKIPCCHVLAAAKGACEPPPKWNEFSSLLLLIWNEVRFAAAFGVN